SVRERKGVTAMYPANQAVEEIMGRLGGSVTAADETLVSTPWAGTARMWAHFPFTQWVTAWLVHQFLKQAHSRHINLSLYVHLGLRLTLPQTKPPLKELGPEQGNTGGLNETLNRGWIEYANRRPLAAALDAVYARVTGAAD